MDCYRVRNEGRPNISRYCGKLSAYMELVLGITWYVALLVALTCHEAAHGFAEPRYRAVIWGLDPGRETLTERIDARVNQMMEEGFLAEVAGLLERGLARDSPGLSCPGYRELAAHLAGEDKSEGAGREEAAGMAVGQRR